MNGLLKERGGLPTALKIAKLPTSYHFSLFPQVFSRRRAAINRCVSCGSRVTNGNVGGNDGRSAVSELLWCLRCADYPEQLLLALGCAE